MNEAVRLRSRKECADAIKAVAAELAEGKTSLVKAEATCREVAEGGEIAWEAVQDILELAGAAAAVFEIVKRADAAAEAKASLRVHKPEAPAEGWKGRLGLELSWEEWLSEGQKIRREGLASAEEIAGVAEEAFVGGGALALAEFAEEASRGQTGEAEEEAEEELEVAKPVRVGFKLRPSEPRVSTAAALLDELGLMGGGLTAEPRSRRRQGRGRRKPLRSLKRSRSQYLSLIQKLPWRRPGHSARHDIGSRKC
jgi:hypothetical protein